MTLGELRSECLKYPQLKTLWDRVAGIALNTQTRGLPLALRVYRGEELSSEEKVAFDNLQQQFDAAAADFKQACQHYNIKTPEIRVGDVCALYP